MGNGETIPLSRLKSGIKPFPYAQFAVLYLTNTAGTLYYLKVTRNVKHVTELELLLHEE